MDRGQKSRNFATKHDNARSNVSQRIKDALNRIKHKLMSSGEREVASSKLGNWLMEELLAMDHVAYIRFASVYLDFSDINAFREAIERLDQQKKPRKQRS